jgi:hypothetical protein
MAVLVPGTGATWVLLTGITRVVWRCRCVSPQPASRMPCVDTRAGLGPREREAARVALFWRARFGAWHIVKETPPPKKNRPQTARFSQWPMALPMDHVGV